MVYFAVIATLLFAYPFSAQADTPTPGTPSANAFPTVTLGPRHTYLASGADGLTYFPDEPLSVLQTPKDGGTGQYWLYIVDKDGTNLVRGDSFDSLTQATPVLTPSGSGFDGQYAGVGAVVKTGAHTLLAFYHGEDHTGLPTCKAVAFYASVMLATSDDDGLTLKRVGPVLQGTPKDGSSTSCAQGDGDPSVIVDKTNTYLYAYYTDHCACDRGVQIGMARSPLSKNGEPGSWMKYKDGDFTTPGLGSYDITPVIQAPSAPKADAHGPNVVYSPTLGKYIMIYSVNAYREIAANLPPDESGIYVAYSDDGITWNGQQQLFKIYTVPVLGKAWGSRTSLYLSQSTSSKVSGILFYTYSETWPKPPHYMVGQSIVFAVAS